MDDADVFGAFTAAWRRETELLARALADIAAGRTEKRHASLGTAGFTAGHGRFCAAAPSESDWACLASQRAQVRQVRDHIDQARALIDDTLRTLADSAIWAPLTSAVFGAGERSNPDAT